MTKFRDLMFIFHHIYLFYLHFQDFQALFQTHIFNSLIFFFQNKSFVGKYGYCLCHTHCGKQDGFEISFLTLVLQLFSWDFQRGITNSNNFMINSESVKVTQLCLTLCDPMDFTGCGILQVRILEWVAISFSRGSSQPRD